MRTHNAIAALLMAATCVAGCSGTGTDGATGSGAAGSGGGVFNFSWSKPAPPAPALDPNAYPANYRKQIATYLLTVLTERSDFYNTVISQPAIKPVLQSQRYVVCLQFNGRVQHKNKVVVYLAGTLQQFVDATPEQCGDAVYQPFQELAAAAPS